MAYNGEFFPNPSTICRMIEVKLEAEFQEIQNREWPAWKATQAQAKAEGKLATEEDYARLREVFQRVAFGSELRKGEISGAPGDAGTKKADEMANGSSDDAGS